MNLRANPNRPESKMTRNRIVGCSFLVLPIAVALFSWSLTAQPPILIPIERLDEIGSGYDALTGEKRNGCVESVDLTKAPETNRVQYQGFKSRIATSTSSLTDIFHFDAGIKYSTLFNSASVNVSIDKTFTSSNFNTSIVAQEEIFFEPQTLISFKLTQKAQALAEDPIAFRAACGDRFLGGVVRGGRLWATASAASNTQNSARQIRAHADAKVGSISGWANFNQFVASDLTNSTNEIEIQQSGANLVDPPSNLSGVAGYAANWGTIVQKGPGAIMGAVAYPYSKIPGMFLRFNNADARVNSVRALIALSDTVSSRRADVLSRLRSDSVYFVANQAALKEAQARFDTLAVEVGKTAELCAASDQPPECNLLALRLRLRQIPRLPREIPPQFEGFSIYNHSHEELKALADMGVYHMPLVSEVLHVERAEHPALKRAEAARVVDYYADRNHVGLSGKLRADIVDGLFHVLKDGPHVYPGYKPTEDSNDEYYSLGAFTSLARRRCLTAEEMVKVRNALSRDSVRIKSIAFDYYKSLSDTLLKAPARTNPSC